MKSTITRLAYEAFVLRIERDLLCLKQENPLNEDLVFEIEEFFIDVKIAYVRHLKVSIDYDSLWEQLKKTIQSKIDTASSIRDFWTVDKYSSYMSIYFDIESEFILRDSLFDDTAIANMN